MIDLPTLGIKKNKFVLPTQQKEWKVDSEVRLHFQFRELAFVRTAASAPQRAHVTLTPPELSAVHKLAPTRRTPGGPSWPWSPGLVLVQVVRCFHFHYLPDRKTEIRVVSPLRPVQVPSASTGQWGESSARPPERSVPHPETYAPRERTSPPHRGLPSGSERSVLPPTRALPGSKQRPQQRPRGQTACYSAHTLQNIQEVTKHYPAVPSRSTAREHGAHTHGQVHSAHTQACVCTCTHVCTYQTHAQRNPRSHIHVHMKYTTRRHPRRDTNAHGPADLCTRTGPPSVTSASKDKLTLWSGNSIIMKQYWTETSVCTLSHWWQNTGKHFHVGISRYNLPKGNLVIFIMN